MDECEVIRRFHVSRSGTIPGAKARSLRRASAAESGSANMLATTGAEIMIWLGSQLSFCTR